MSLVWFVKLVYTLTKVKWQGEVKHTIPTKLEILCFDVIEKNSLYTG